MSENMIRLRYEGEGRIELPELKRTVGKGEVIEIRADCGLGPPDWIPADGPEPDPTPYRRGRRAAEE